MIYKSISIKIMTGSCAKKVWNKRGEHAGGVGFSPESFIWVWIGNHEEYERMIKEEG
jgi:hypothetical protein